MNVGILVICAVLSLTGALIAIIATLQDRKERRKQQHCDEEP